MLLSRKIRLIPTPEQEELFWKSAGCARWSYNFFLYENTKTYNDYMCGNGTQKYLSGNSVRKMITDLKHTSHQWLKEVGCNVVKQAVIDAETALKRFFLKTSGFPNYKSRKKSKPSFYVNYESLHRKNGGFHGEKIGFVKTAEPLPKLHKNQHYSNPRISYDGDYWWLSVSYEVGIDTSDTTGEVIGIDLGIKSLATLSNGKVYSNINKSDNIHRLECALKREQRKLSRMIENNTKSYKITDNKRYPIYKRPLSECKNITKQKKKLRKLYRRMKNIRTDYLYKTTTEIVKTKPSRIIVEDLCVSGMMQNHCLANAIQTSCFWEFLYQIEYKCELHSIEFVKVDRFYPSSKMCSNCNTIKSDLKLKDRTYKCDVCGLSIDRDLNASINLANYCV